jgi:glutamate--cysteine ligase
VNSTLLDESDMSNPGQADATPFTSTRQLADYLAAGAKPRERFTIGTEHEKFGVRFADFAAPPYEPGGIRALLEGMAAADGWEPIRDGGNPIGLSKGTASVSLEPAGQVELSGGLLETVHDTRDEMAAHIALARRVAEPLGFGFVGLGFHPTLAREQMPWMPKGRYAVMRRYMPTVGSLGLDMMTRTCTVQANLDFADEADMVRKMRVGLALQPVASALFANSPFTEGRPNGFLSYRAHVWTDTDPHRTGIPAVFFEDGFGFERYADWLIDDVPMYFVYRDGRYVDLAGKSFRRFMQGAFPEAGPATMGDAVDHVTTVFTDVRLKRFIEMRGADAGSLEMMVAQTALWVGLLYDEAALAAAAALVRRHSWQEFAALRLLVPRLALGAPWQDGTVRELAREVVAIARDGLRARRRLDRQGRDETVHLAPLEALVAGAPTQAERWLAKFYGNWNGDITAIFRSAAL